MPLFGVIVGGHSQDHRLRSARETRQRDVAGVTSSIAVIRVIEANMDQKSK